jgi:hypothetical protein
MVRPPQREQLPFRKTNQSKFERYRARRYWVGG